MANVINSYETVIVVSAKVGEEGDTAVVEKYKKLIGENGTVESVDEWGKRRLAYPIQKQTEAFYTLINFKSAAVSQLNSTEDIRSKKTFSVPSSLRRIPDS